MAFMCCLPVMIRVVVAAGSWFWCVRVPGRLLDDVAFPVERPPPMLSVRLSVSLERRAISDQELLKYTKPTVRSCVLTWHRPPVDLSASPRVHWPLSK